MKNYDKHTRPFETNNQGFVGAIINLCRNQSNPLREPGNEPDYSSLIEEVIFEAQLDIWKRVWGYIGDTLDKHGIVGGIGIGGAEPIAGAFLHRHTRTESLLNGADMINHVVVDRKDYEATIAILRKLRAAIDASPYIGADANGGSLHEALYSGHNVKAKMGFSDEVQKSIDKLLSGILSEMARLDAVQGMCLVASLKERLVSDLMLRVNSMSNELKTLTENITKDINRYNEYIEQFRNI